MPESGGGVKEKIIEAATALLQEKKSAEQVSMREIARRAGVAVSMINYHFQTKENLVNIAVQRFIGSVIAGADSRIAMRDYLKRAMYFVASQPGIARVSILSDYASGGREDNSSQVAESVYRILKEQTGPGHDDLELRLMAHIQVAAVQVLFLRSELFREVTGMDFFDDGQRDRLMDMIIDITTSTGGMK